MLTKVKKYFREKRKTKKELRLELRRQKRMNANLIFEGIEKNKEISRLKEILAEIKLEVESQQYGDIINFKRKLSEILKKN